MIRPCYLVIDREFPGSISTRKLVIETAKFNVLTAYSGAEAREMLARFPAVSGIVIDARLEDVDSGELIREMKQSHPHLPVVLISAPDDKAVPEADITLESFEPAKLLETLRKLKPEASNEIEKRNEELSHEHLK